MSEQSAVVNDLLRAWGQGNLQARDELLSLVYGELRKRAARYLRDERHASTLQPTALVHEAFIRLAGGKRIGLKSRGQFFAMAAQIMRHILVDHARARSAQKRPNAALRMTLDEQAQATHQRDCELLLLDQALDDLSRRDARQSQIVELRYFGGLSEYEIAEALGLSRATVTREWRTARAWLYRRVTRGATANS